MLPKMAHQDGISKWRSVQFGGIVHTLAAGNGDIWDDCNIVSDNAPVLTTREAEHKITTGFHGIYGCLQIGDAETDTIQLGASAMKYKGVSVTWAFSEMQTLTPFNYYAVIMPAKRWVRTDVVEIKSAWPQSANYGDVYCVGTTCKYWDGSAWQDVGALMGNIEASVTLNVTITDGEYAGVPAEANTINSSTGDFRTSFAAGDALELSGTAFPTTRTLVVREVQQRKLVFYEHSFDDEKTSTPKSATIARKMPDMDWTCVNESRMWGCKGKTIYASKLADFKNWNVFDGLASDSYAVDVPGEGDFTGCVTFMGYPIFFKEAMIYKVYGNRPSNFEVMGSASTGTVNGKTLAIANETLFYLSKVGVMQYSGGVPQPISDVLGDIVEPWADAQAFSDKYRYMLWHGTTSEMLEFDPRKGVWHRQRISGWTGNISYAWRNTDGAAFVSTTADLWARQSGGTTETIPFSVEFADFTEDSSDSPAYGANAKGTGKLQLRLTLGDDSSAAISMRFDSRGDWLPVKTLETAVKRSYYLPIIPRRSDHFRIKIEGEGYMELYSLSRESYKGSALRTI